VSLDLPEKLRAFITPARSASSCRAGGTINYGVIVANKIDKALFEMKQPAAATG